MFFVMDTPFVGQGLRDITTMCYKFPADRIASLASNQRKSQALGLTVVGLVLHGPAPHHP